MYFKRAEQSQKTLEHKTIERPLHSLILLFADLAAEFNLLHALAPLPLPLPAPLIAVSVAPLPVPPASAASAAAAAPAADCTAEPGALFAVERPDARFECSGCGRSYATRRACHEHFAMHLGKTTCTLCSAVFCTEAHLRAHMRIVHGQEISYKRIRKPKPPDELVAPVPKNF
jgi:C2H2-type zinc finger